MHPNKENKPRIRFNRLKKSPQLIKSCSYGTRKA